MELLARLEPEVAATGHGIPMHGEALRTQLVAFAPRFDVLARPKAGRYARQPATADASGVRSVPPPLVNPWLAGLAVAGLAIGAAALAASGNGKKKNGRAKARKDKRPKSGADSSYRAWYRDSPAELGSSGPDWQYRRPSSFSERPAAGQSDFAPLPDDQTREDPSAHHADHRYSDQSSRKIETQYP